MRGVTKGFCTFLAHSSTPAPHPSDPYPFFQSVCALGFQNPPTTTLDSEMDTRFSTKGLVCYELPCWAL